MINRRVGTLVAPLLLLAIGEADARAQESGVPLPLTAGSAIVQTLAFTNGDRESVHRVLEADPQGLRYEWSLVEAHAAGDTARQAFRYREGSADVAGARRLWLFHGRDEPEAHPGYTMQALSRATYRRVRAGQPDSLQIMALETPGSQLGFVGFGGARPAPVRWRGTLAPVAPGTVAFPLLVNGRRVEVPALRLRGDLTARPGRWTPEIWILADSTYPLLLKWVGAFGQPDNVLQTIRVDRPSGVAVVAGGDGPLLDASVENDLGTACRVELPGIYFDFNSAALDPASDRTIAAVAAMLARHPDWHATLEGHTDSIGSPEANRTLSERRVEAVRARLVQTHAVNPERLRTVGYGSAHPREPNATIEGRARNRRVELVRECSQPN